MSARIHLQRLFRAFGGTLSSHYTPMRHNGYLYAADRFSIVKVEDDETIPARKLGAQWDACIAKYKEYSEKSRPLSLEYFDNIKNRCLACAGTGISKSDHPCYLCMGTRQYPLSVVEVEGNLYDNCQISLLTGFNDLQYAIVDQHHKIKPLYLTFESGEALIFPALELEIKPLVGRQIHTTDACK